MAISYDHTIETTLEKENIGLIIGVKGANLNKYIHDRAKKEYCDAMNQGNPNEIELRVYFEDNNGKVNACWNNIDEVEMRIMNDIVKKHIESEVKRINDFTNKPKAKLMVNKKVSKTSERNYIVKINVGKYSVSKIIGKNGCNSQYLKDKIREKIEKCGSIYVKVSDTNDSIEKIYDYSEPFEGGGTPAWIFVNIATSEKVFPLVMCSIKEFMEQLFRDESDEDDEDDEYDEYDRSDW